ncbi:hypothetical protein L7F22_019127 [Adiantum nelumboides]|nr:hypothetical protein [Adiantum nelumboides]
MGDSAYRGISADQDGRFRNKEQLLLKKLAAKGQFPDSFEERVNMKNVNLEVIRPWITEKVEEILGFEDDVVVEYVNGMLQEEGSNNVTHLDPKKMQLSLTGFLESKTPAFMAELWSLLLSAQKSIGGIPQEFVEKKKQEMRLARERDAAAISGSGLNRRQPGRTDDRPPHTRSRFEDRSNRSRWDDEPRSRNSGRNEFVDRRGNRTERVHDTGWGAQRSNESRSRRSPSPSGYHRHRSRSPSRYERQEKHSRYFDNGNNKEGDHHQSQRYESRKDEQRTHHSYKRKSPPRKNKHRRSPDSSPSRSPEVQQRRKDRQTEGSVTPDYRARQKYQPSPSLTPPPRRKDERSPTYSPPGVQWEEDSDQKQEEQSKRNRADKLSRSRWANDD